MKCPKCGKPYYFPLLHLRDEHGVSEEVISKLAKEIGERILTDEECQELIKRVLEEREVEAET